ncbi:MAG: hypothetical protein M0011_07550, partial [Elusimicrobia bacterium]|nr:hypothetical protein [Elusimicrobiota bacterium]
MNILEQQDSNRRMTALIMGGFIAFFLFLGLGFDYFYLNFRPAADSDVVMNSEGFYEAKRPAGASSIPFGTIIALLFGAGMTVNSYFNGPRMVLRSTMAR